MVKRYNMPKGCPVATVDIREITGAHELEAAKMADATTSRPTPRLLVEAERREAVRLSVARLDDREVDHAIPLFEIDQWPRRAREALARYFADVNGIAGDDLKAMEAGAEVLRDGARFGRRFTLPSGCSIATIDVWELGGHEELEAAIRADSVQHAGVTAAALVHRRMLIAAAARKPDMAEDFNTWTLRTTTAVGWCYEAVNGIPEDEIQGCMAAAVEVGAAPAEMNQPRPQGVAGATG